MIQVKRRLSGPSVEKWTRAPSGREVSGPPENMAEFADAESAGLDWLRESLVG